MKRAAPVLLGFFVMGMVDVVGVATNYARSDFRLRDSVANLLPLTVFMVSRSRLPLYVLPLFAPLAVLVALVLAPLRWTSREIGRAHV